MEAETTEQASATEMAACVVCKELLADKNPHLLMCLHSVCRSCLSDESAGGDRGECSETLEVIALRQPLQ